MNIAAVILAGGAGTRLWPLSSDENPKQFLQLFDGQSLLQRTWARIAAVVPAEAIYVSTNERYRARCAAQLPALHPSNIVTEPSRRNTAPAIALTCLTIARDHGDVTIAILPADHAIEDAPGFAAVLRRGLDYAATHDALVTIGITPSEPHTGYGYLELGDEVAPGVVALRRFVEKPSLETAIEYQRSGGYAWNAGMFLWRASLFRDALSRTAPAILELAEKILATPQDTPVLYAQMPDISIDYALLEKAPNLVALPASFDWSDVGSWAAVARLAKGSGAVLRDASNVFAHSAGGKRIIVIGASNLAVIESEEGVLVLDLAHSEALAAVVKTLPQE